MVKRSGEKIDYLLSEVGRATGETEPVEGEAIRKGDLLGWLVR